MLVFYFFCTEVRNPSRVSLLPLFSNFHWTDTEQSCMNNSSNIELKSCDKINTLVELWVCFLGIRFTASMRHAV